MMAGWDDTTNSTTTNVSVWDSWCSSATSDTTWQAWNPYSHQPTEEERQAAEQRSRERAEAAKEAKQRALALLREVLDARQREELDRHRYFTVHSRSSQRRYRVQAGRGKHGNIVEVDADGREVASLCAAPVGALPEGDYLAAQKLCLEHDEEAFRRTANITPLRRSA